MKEYNELIKKIEKMRRLVRDFFVFGYRSRIDYDENSARSYDDQKRRIASYFGELFGGERDKYGKRVAIFVDSDSVDSNPLYRLYKAKSFTRNDLVFHFVIMDVLQDLKEATASRLYGEFTGKAYGFISDYGNRFGEKIFQTKLNEYEELGILLCEKRKNGPRVYRLGDVFNTSGLDRDLVCFFSEVNVLGVIGSYVLDRYEKTLSNIKFKHRQLFAALDSLNMFVLLNAIDGRNVLHITRQKEGDAHSEPDVLSRTVVPLKILVNRQNGRQYLASFDCTDGVFVNFRLDHITDVQFAKKTVDETEFQRLRQEVERRLRHTWNVNYYTHSTPQRVELVIRVGENEEFIVTRLMREGHCGKVEQLSDGAYRYTNSVFDPSEMIPWIKSFIGRIVSFRCEDKEIEEKFYRDLNHMMEDWLNEE